MAKDFVNDDIITPDLATKWDKAAETVATKTTKGLMSGTDKTKLDGVEANANNYKHPTTHPAAVIVQNASNRFVTDTEKTNWNGKASTAVVTTAKSGLMSSADKTKLDGVATRANNYSHPTTHLPAVIVQDASNRFVTDAEKTNWNGKAPTTVATTAVNGLMPSVDKVKLNGIATNANNYIHPATHPPNVIAQNASNRFVTDTEKSVWNGKLNGNANAVSATKLLTGRTIAGVRFDGTANIAITASNVGAYTRAETDNKINSLLTSEMSGQVIFEGAAYFNGNQEYFYNYNKMKIGLFLTWSAYKVGVGPENSHFSTQIIPKEQIKSWPGNSSVVHLGVINTRMRRKMVYANRARIVGRADNGTGDNREYAIRKITVI
ncbi:hypothetical protein [Vagococcus salmoninarum]|uniref:hypothetical protein n=1 Tax=Vagococcus salmoninarum TaxID=2739 RepID=UPI001880A07B|nr:hypothetical protein [Vagococcus salmoninarum]MBE9389999.1 hypothetical protein [Vagococcus salmoninarum]